MTRITSITSSIALLALGGAWSGCSSSSPGVVLSLSTDPTTAMKIDSYCVSLGADGARRYGRHFSTARNALPQTLGIDSDDRTKVEARIDGFAEGRRIASSANELSLPKAGVTNLSLPLAACVPSSVGALAKGAQLSTVMGDRVAIVRTGAEVAGASELVGLASAASVRQRFGGTALTTSALPGVGAPVLDVLTFDVDGDCADDLVVLGAGPPVVWPSAVDGSLAPDATRTNAEQPAVAGAAADLDGDGFADLVTVGNDGASVYLSTVASGGKGFAEHVNAFSPVPTFGSAIAIADLDGDSIFDVLVGFGASSNTAPRVFHGDGHGSFSSATELPTALNAEAIALVDIDGDGDLDALVGTDGVATQSIGLGVFVNDGHGTFTDATSTLAPVDVPSEIDQFLVADLDGDCVSDVLALQPSGAPLLLAAMGPTSRGAVGTESVHAAASGDLDGDGKLDLVFATQTGIAIWNPAR